MFGRARSWGAAAAWAGREAMRRRAAAWARPATVACGGWAAVGGGRPPTIRLNTRRRAQLQASTMRRHQAAPRLCWLARELGRRKPWLPRPARTCAPAARLYPHPMVGPCPCLWSPPGARAKGGWRCWRPTACTRGGTTGGWTGGGGGIGARASERDGVPWVAAASGRQRRAARPAPRRRMRPPRPTPLLLPSLLPGWPPPAGTQNPSLWLDKVLEQLSGNLTDKDGSVEAACEDGGELQAKAARAGWAGGRVPPPSQHPSRHTTPHPPHLPLPTNHS